MKANFGGLIRQDAMGFSIGSKGYIGGGFDGIGTYYDDFWEYDPTLDLWTQKANMLGGISNNAAAFTIGGKGYFCDGGNPNPINDLIEYDPSINTWTLITPSGSLPPARIDAKGFSIGGKGYISTGYTNSGRLKDLWEYSLDVNLGTNDLRNETQIEIFPNPFTEKLTINSNNYEPSEITLYDLSSRKLLQQTFTNTTTINTEQLAKGMYLYTVRNRNGIVKNGKVIKQ